MSLGHLLVHGPKDRERVQRLLPTGLTRLRMPLLLSGFSAGVSSAIASAAIYFSCDYLIYRYLFDSSFIITDNDLIKPHHLEP